MKIPGWTGRTVPQNEPFSAIFCLEQNVAVNIKNNKCFRGYRTDSCPSEYDFFKTGINIRYATVTLVGYALVVKLVRVWKMERKGCVGNKISYFPKLSRYFRLFVDPALKAQLRLRTLTIPRPGSATSVMICYSKVNM